MFGIFPISVTLNNENSNKKNSVQYKYICEAREYFNRTAFLRHTIWFIVAQSKP